MGFLEKIYSKSPVPLQTMMLNAKAIELYVERYGKKFWDMAEQFEKNQWRSSGDLKEWQTDQLKRLIREAYNHVPFYHQIFKENRLTPDDIKSLDDISKIPVLTKDVIKQNYSKMISTKLPRWKLRHGHTSGTTGSPLDLVYDIETCVAHHAADWRQKNWAGLTYGTAFASIQGRVVVPVKQKKPPFWRKNHINNQLFLSSFHLTNENIPRYFDELKRNNIQFLEGYPSTVSILALWLNKNGMTFPLKAVLTSSETLFGSQREIIEKSFCCKIFDFYGMAERAVFASECEQHIGHHLNEDYGITEFLDDRNEPVDPGHLGHIVATSLYNQAMPLIRYKTNDSCSLKAIKCRCGRTFALMDDVATKNESIVSLPDGRLISPSVLTHPFKPMVNIIESQIIQDTIEELTVKIVKNERYSQEDERMLLAAFKQRLGEIRITIEYCEVIPRTKNGKFKWVVSSIAPQFNEKSLSIPKNIKDSL